MQINKDNNVGATIGRLPQCPVSRKVANIYLLVDSPWPIVKKRDGHAPLAMTWE